MDHAGAIPALPGLSLIKIVWIGESRHCPTSAEANLLAPRTQSGA